MTMQETDLCLSRRFYAFLCRPERLIQPPEGDRLLSGVLHQPMKSRLNRRIWLGIGVWATAERARGRSEGRPPASIGLHDSKPHFMWKPTSFLVALANAILTHFFSIIYKVYKRDMWLINCNASPTSTCEKDKALAGGKPPIYDW